MSRNKSPSEEMSEEMEIRRSTGSTSVSVTNEVLAGILRRPLTPGVPLRRTSKVSNLSFELESQLNLSQKIKAWNIDSGKTKTKHKQINNNSSQPNNIKQHNNNNVVIVARAKVEDDDEPLDDDGDDNSEHGSSSEFSNSNSSTRTVVANPAVSPEPEPVPSVPEPTPVTVPAPSPSEPFVTTGAGGPPGPYTPPTFVATPPDPIDPLSVGDGKGRKPLGPAGSVRKKSGASGKSKLTKSGMSGNGTGAYPFDIDVTATIDEDKYDYTETSSGTKSKSTKDKAHCHKKSEKPCTGNGMGAISFKVPGKITHKTTIKIAHYPQPGCEIVNIEAPVPAPSGYDAEELVIHEDEGPAFCEEACGPGTVTCEPQPQCPGPGFPLPPGNYANNCNYYMPDPRVYQMYQQQQQQQYQYQCSQGMYNPYCGNFSPYNQCRK